jgi:cyclic-di-GMP phosphodiesterase TipF (flagellum assembly factor)
MRLKFFSALGERGVPDGLLEIVLWAVIGGSLGSTALSFVGGTPGIAIVGGLVAAVGAASLAHAWRETQTRLRLERTLSDARREMIDLIERQALSDAKMAEIERRTIESPALVWRAATEDIEALSGLVSRLATAVADHDQRLAALQAAQVAQPRVETPPAPASERAPTPQPVLRAVEAPPPAVIAELKTTLAAALASDRLELFLEPVAALPQRSIKGYEATLRLKGAPPEEADLRRVATATGLRADLDRLLVERAAQVLRILRARNREATALCRIGGESLTSETFRAALDALGRSDPALSAAVTLEIAEAEYAALEAAGREAMGAIAERGFSFSLSDLGRLSPALAEAGALGVNRLRIAADDLLRAQTADSSDIHPADVPEFLRRRGLELLVTGVETEQTVLDLLEVAAPLAMGPLFGVARPVRPEILEPKAVQSAGSREEPAAEEASAAPRPRRQSFRSVLRRA